MTPSPTQHTTKGTNDMTINLAHGSIKSGFSMMDVIGHVIIWLIISVITLGIGLFFWPYAAAKQIVNGITLYDSTGARVGKLQCNISLGAQLGHVILWLILTVITLGIAFPFYIFGVARTVINKTEVV